MAENNYKSIDDIVFEHKNKEYGAYNLRKVQKSILLKSFLVGATAFVLLFLITFFYNQWEAKNKKREVAVDLDLTEINQQKKEEDKVEDIKEEKKEEAPKQEETAQVKMIPPEPKKDNLVKHEETIPEVKQTENKDLGTENREGKASAGVVGGGAVNLQGPPVHVQQKVEVVDDNKVFDNVEQEAQYPGGMQALLSFIGENLEYPQKAQDNGTQGKLIVKFVVEKDGTVGSFQTVRPLGDGCEEEVFRILKKTKKWKPALVNNKPVRSYYRLPVVFRLPE